MKITRRQLRRIIREERARLISEAMDQSGVVESISAGVQEAVDQGLGLFDIEGILRGPAYGFTAETVTSPLPMVMIDTRGKKYVVINSKYAESPDAVVGKYAIGVLE